MASRVSSLEPWMVSNVAAGAAQLSFMALLIPPFVLAATGSAVRSGIVLAVVGLAALSGPLIGRYADKHDNHALLYVSSIFLLSVCFLFLALDADRMIYSPVIGFLLGIAFAAQGTIGPALVVGSGLSQAEIAGQLTMFGLSLPIGQLIGALVVVAGQLAGLSFEGLFLLASGVLLAMAFLTWATINAPITRLLTHKSRSANVSKPTAASGWKDIFFSVFGLFLLAATVGAIANNGLYSQVANILPAVYGFAAWQASLVVAFAGFLSVGAIILSGMWMKKYGSLPVYSRGAFIKFVGMAGMTAVGMLSGSHLLIAALMVQLAYIGPLITRTASAAVAGEISPVTTSEAMGYYLASSALGALIGSLGAGFLAEYVSFNAVNWMNALLSAAAVFILFAILSPRVKNYRALFVTT